MHEMGFCALVYEFDGSKKKGHKIMTAKRPLKRDRDRDRD